MFQKILKKSVYILNQIEDGLIIFSLSAMIIIAGTRIVMRNFGFSGLLWGDTVLRYSVLWIGMLGANLATREENHININIVSGFIKGRNKEILAIITNFFAASICAFMTYSSVLFVIDEKTFHQLLFNAIPSWVMFLIMPVAFSIMSLRFSINGILRFRNALNYKADKHSEQADAKEEQE